MHWAGGYVCPGGCLPGGVCLGEGVSALGVCLPRWVSAQEVSDKGRTPPIHMLVKTLPFRNYIADGNDKAD